MIMRQTEMIYANTTNDIIEIIGHLYIVCMYRCVGEQREEEEKASSFSFLTCT